MPVITVSRGSFSGGKAFAECLAGRLGYRCVDRDVVVEKAAAYGVPQEALRDALTRPPTFWDRFKHTKYTYLSLIQAALAAEVQHGNVVYHGNAGHLLLRGVSHVMRVRIIAPIELRVTLTQERLKLAPDEALPYIEKADHDRRKWTQYLYGVEWGDPTLYDVVLNLEVMDVEQGCQVVALAARQPCFQETPASQTAMSNLVLASRVRASLVLSAATSGLEVDVLARDGAVTIDGRVTSAEQASDVRAIVTAVPGVTEVHLNLYSAAHL